MSRNLRKKISIREFKEQLVKSLSVMKYFSNIAWKTKKIYFLYYGISIIVSGFGPFISIIGMQLLVDEIAYVEKRNITRVIAYAAFIVFGDIFYIVLDKFALDKKNMCVDKIDREVTMMIDDVSMGIKFEDTENPLVLDQMKKACNGYSQVGFSGIANLIQSILSNIIVVLGVAFLVVRCSFILLIVILANFIIASILNSKVAKINYEYFPKVIDKERGMDYITNKLPTYQFGKDVRLYDATGMIINRQHKLTEEIVANEKYKYHDVWKIRRIFQISDKTLTGAIYAILAVEAFFEKITIGEITSLVNAITKFSSALNNIIDSLFEVQKNTKILEETVRYLNTSQDEKVGETPQIKESIVIEFKNVNFKYPRNKEYILKNVNVKIAAGEHVAIVGENGAGKTTFIKLICRLYKVTEGEILLNGRNINDYKFEDYVKLLSVVFQDFKLLAFTFRDNITLGADASEDSKIIKLCETAGIADRVNKSDKKLDTSVYKMFEEDGVVPSGGEAQKLAIVRALYKDAPLVILDEPTAALDPISEYEIYKHFNNLVGEKTALYISHRLSSCRFCDRIIVFAENTIMEDGSHEELIKKENGIYSNMYNVQSQYYA